MCFGNEVVISSDLSNHKGLMHVLLFCSVFHPKVRCLGRNFFIQAVLLLCSESMGSERIKDMDNLLRERSESDYSEELDESLGTYIDHHST